MPRGDLFPGRGPASCVASTLLLIAAVGLAACGDSENGEPTEAVGAEVTCTPVPRLGPELDVRAGWDVGDRFSFAASFSKTDSDDEDENYEATREGEFAVAAASPDGYEVEWQMEDGLSVAFGNEPPERFTEVFGDDPELNGTYEVSFATNRRGALKELLNQDELRALGERMADTVAEQSPEEGEALRALLTSGALLKTKFIEKAILMQYPTASGSTLESRAPIARRSRMPSEEGPCQETRHSKSSIPKRKLAVWSWRSRASLIRRRFATQSAASAKS